MAAAGLDSEILGYETALAMIDWVSLEIPEECAEYRGSLDIQTDNIEMRLIPAINTDSIEGVVEPLAGDDRATV